jgi:hypothetical protein
MLSGARLFSHALALSFKCSDKVIEPNSGVLLPIELDYAVAKLDPFRQWHGTNQEAKAFRSAQSLTITAECFQLSFLLEAMRIVSCMC